ncbi:hypothetical protein BV53_05370 [Candidatus Synechococcus spongiarum LMB bulk15N]|uniref:Uncharacterized protein n=1 Tax=Candidatus Synechococcus spongiarum LMB bulk15N TaxID=1943583 RepID=A0A1T1D154_9SYNE|nr:hypothetical protein BV53_05370 [Candidatus Synechococcus spongiarum LMB bulk15N]
MSQLQGLEAQLPQGFSIRSDRPERMFQAFLDSVGRGLGHSRRLPLHQPDGLLFQSHIHA